MAEAWRELFTGVPRLDSVNMDTLEPFRFPLPPGGVYISVHEGFGAADQAGRLARWQAERQVCREVARRFGLR